MLAALSCLCPIRDSLTPWHSLSTTCGSEDEPSGMLPADTLCATIGCEDLPWATTECDWWSKVFLKWQEEDSISKLSCCCLDQPVCDLDIISSPLEEKRHHFFSTPLVPCRCPEHPFCDLDIIPSSLEQKRRIASICSLFQGRGIIES